MQPALTVYNAPFPVEKAIGLYLGFLPWHDRFFGPLKSKRKGPTRQEVAKVVGCSLGQFDKVIKAFRNGGLDGVAKLSWAHTPRFARFQVLPDEVVEYAVKPAVLREHIGLSMRARCHVLSDRFNCPVTLRLLQRTYRIYNIRYGTIKTRLGGQRLPPVETQRTRL